MRRFALLLATTCLCACAATSPWQTYDETSYAAVMDSSDEVLAKHIAALEGWVAGPAEAVPPGIYTELAYWLAKVGRTAEARVLFQREIERYPYAQKYVQMLMSVVLPATGGETKSPSATPAEPKP